MFFGRSPSSPTWIVVFLGNPGARYQNTRHNAGFMTADIIEKSTGIKINRMRFNALTTTIVLSGQKVLLLKPQSYMNLSGTSVSQAMRFLKVPLDNVIVVSDDVSMPNGKLRVRRSGSAGGHNGLKDIIAKCGGEGFPRVKIGIGAPPNEDYDLADWVLSKPSGPEMKLLVEAAAKAAKAMELIIGGGIEQAMATYNS